MPSGRIASVRFGYPTAPYGLRSVTLQGKAILKELHSGFGRVHNHAVHPRSVFAAVLLGDLTDCQQLCGLRVDEELLKVLHLFVLPVASSSEDPPLQTPYACLDGSPVDVLPFQFASWGRFNDEHCLTSPQVRTFKGFASEEDQPEVCTLSGWVSPLLRPYPHRYSAAFAFSGFLYPLHHPRSLRFGYHDRSCRRGAHGAYPVDRRGLERLGVGAIYDPVGVVEYRRAHSDHAVHPTYLLVLAFQPLTPVVLDGPYKR